MIIDIWMSNIWAMYLLCTRECYRRDGQYSGCASFKDKYVYPRIYTADVPWYPCAGASKCNAVSRYEISSQSYRGEDKSCRLTPATLRAHTHFTPLYFSIFCTNVWLIRDYIGFNRVCLCLCKRSFRVNTCCRCMRWPQALPSRPSRQAIFDKAHISCVEWGK